MCMNWCSNVFIIFTLSDHLRDGNRIEIRGFGALGPGERTVSSLFY